MPKMKTHSGASKRFKRTATGKIVRSHTSGSHILTKKHQSRKRRLRAQTLVSQADFARISSLLPKK